MPVTTEQIFRDQSKPAWMHRQEQLVLDSFEQSVTVDFNFNYRQAAYAVLHRISQRPDAPKLPNRT
jgi:hypothetical protein